MKNNVKPYACHICSSKNLIVFNKFSQFKQVTSDCKPWHEGDCILYCEICKTVQKKLTESWYKDISDIYATYSVYSQSDGAEQTVFEQDSGMNMSRSIKIINNLLNEITLVGSGRLLDVGCGNGAMLKSFSSILSGWSYSGTETNDNNLKTLEKINGFENLYTCPVKDIAEKFDVITMLHSLEHIPNPVEILCELKEKLTSDGILFIQVPNLNANPFDLLIADHCTHFDSKSLESAVIKAGFEVIKSSEKWIPKEISLVASKKGTRENIDQYEIDSDSTKNTEIVTKSLEWLNEIVKVADTADGKELAIFGSSIAATWLATQTSKEVIYFIDEDKNRIGKNHIDISVISPDSINEDIPVLIPLPYHIAMTIVERLKSLNINFIVPPEFT